MFAILRLLTVCLTLFAAPLYSTAVLADNHSQSREPKHLYRSLDQYKGAFKRMDDRQLRKFIRDFRAHINDQNRSELEVRLRLFEAELQRRQGAGQPAQDQQPVAVTKHERAARELLAGAAPARDMRNEALAKRIKLSRKLVKHPKVQANTRAKLQQLLAEDNQEWKIRREAAETPQVADSERQARKLLRQAAPASELNAIALRKRIGDVRALLQDRRLRPQTRDELERLLAADQSEFKGRTAENQTTPAERDATRFLRQAGPAADLNTRALRRRIQQTEQFLSQGGLGNQTTNGLAELRNSDRRELRQRRNNDQTQTSGGQEATGGFDRQARQLLRDDRPAETLGDRELRERLGQTRQLLQQPNLPDRLSRQLRQRLQLDRRELRTRLEARRNNEEPGIVEAPRSELVIALLNDQRPSHALRSKQLSRRIDQATRVIDSPSLNRREQRWLQDMVMSDRRELRERLRDRRLRRQAELDRRRRDNDLNIVIAPRLEFAPREDVAAAEADDEAIERQLIAPPTARIDRRYSFDEFRRRPGLRHLMPAVEVDSIKFGFNESFVREEEVDELERLGAVIERVVAANPEEVFLIEGHTDAVGSDGYNLLLSEKRAEAVKNALIDYFVIRPENLATIGYGEQFLKIPTLDEEQENRRVSVRRITPLLAGRVQ